MIRDKIVLAAKKQRGAGAVRGANPPPAAKQAAGPLPCCCACLCAWQPLSLRGSCPLSVTCTLPVPPAASGEGISQPHRWGFAGGAFQLARLRGAQEVSGLEEGEWCLDLWPRTHAVPNLSLDKGDEAADPLESSGVGCSPGRDGSFAGSALGLSRGARGGHPQYAQGTICPGELLGQPCRVWLPCARRWDAAQGAADGLGGSLLVAGVGRLTSGCLFKPVQSLALMHLAPQSRRV